MSTSEEIPALSIIAEPLLVAFLLTTGCIINRRKTSQLRAVESIPQSLNHAHSKLPFLGKMVNVPDNSKFAGNITSRALARFPFLMEIWYWLLTYWVYQIARACQALTMGKGTTITAQAHGEAILSLEKFLHIDVELPLQHLLLQSPNATWTFNKLYALVHIPATITYIAYSYYAFTPSAFQKIRRTMVGCNLIAFIIFSAWPCMPPRLLPESFGYIDTVHLGKAASAWTTNRFQNQLAAFPSLHQGYSLVIGVALFVHSPNRIVRAVALFYPLLILLVIMATANHYLLDAVGGALVTVLAYRINTWFLHLRPLEEWAFWVFRTQKPMEKEEFERLTSDYYLPLPLNVSPRSIASERLGPDYDKLENGLKD